MPDLSFASDMPAGPRTEVTKGEKHRRVFIPSSEPHDLAWLTWWSNGCEHGLKAAGWKVKFDYSEGTRRIIGDKLSTMIFGMDVVDFVEAGCY